MKQLRLEVGKTYRNRKGEEVKIVRENKYIYQGSNGEWYTDSGRWEDYGIDDPRDLIEEVPTKATSYALGILGGMKEATRHTFKIPEGVKKVTVEQVGNRIVVEMVPEEGPKPGDVLVNEHGSVYIFKEVRYNGELHNHFVWLGDGGRLAIGELCLPGRPATPEEAQILFDALKKAGKRWNPETMQVEDVPEIDRIREWVEVNIKDGYYNHEDISEAIEAYLKHKEGEK